MQKGDFRGHYSRLDAPGAVTHNDGRRGYSSLVDVGYSKRFRVEYGANEFVRSTRQRHWEFIERHLVSLTEVKVI